MKKTIISQNFNGWCPVTKINNQNKIKLFSQYLKNKYDNLCSLAVINLQEFIGGKDGNFIDQLQKEFPDYEILTPPGFNHLEHPKSILNVTLIRKNYAYKLKNFDCCLPNRICYVKIWLNDNLAPLNIMNVYSVQTKIFSERAAGWYVNKREAQKKELWEAIFKEAKNCKEPLLICGDLQENSKTGQNIRTLIEMGFKERNSDFFTTASNGKFSEEKTIYHFLYNTDAWEKFYPKFFQYDINLLDKLSDHVMLCATSN